MRRYEAIKLIMEHINNEIMISNIGHPSQELFAIKDRPDNFYMLGSMGLASSIGLGVALSSPKKIVVIDGDGSVLMNLGSLATIGANQPKNYCLFIIDNESYGSTGFQPTFTSKNIKLHNISKSCGIEKTFLCRNKTDCENIIPEAINNNEGPFCVIIKTLKGNPDDIAIIPHNPEFIKKRFMERLGEK